MPTGLEQEPKRNSNAVKIKAMERLCIYPKDIQIITGRTERYGRKLIKKIKESLGKEEYQFITIEEFCQYTGLCPQTVKGLLRS